MKEFRKDEQGNFICEECGKLCKSLNGLVTHIRYFHNKEYKHYFDKWLKDDDDGLCKICRNSTAYIKVLKGYSKYCSKECGKKLHYVNLKLSNLKKYGVENQFQRKEVQDQMKETCIEHFGVEYASQSSVVQEKIKMTCIEKYGVEHHSQLEEIKEQKKETCLKNFGVKAGFADVDKREKTCLKKFGVKNISQLDEIIEQKKQTHLKKYGVEAGFNQLEKCRKTCLLHYGVENPAQNKEIHERQMKSAFKLKPYKNTGLYYQGSNEYDFLEKCYEKYKKDITRGPSVKYKYKRKTHTYHPDFYIETLNLVIECKNSWLAKKDKYILELKKQAVLDAKYDYIMIVDKNYQKFDKLLKTMLLK